MRKIHLELTEDQATQVIRILDYGKADHTDPTFSAEDKQFNAFISRIQVKLKNALAKAKTSTT